MAFQHILSSMFSMMHERNSFVHFVMRSVIESLLMGAAAEKNYQKEEKNIIFHGLMFLNTTCEQ